MAASSRWNSGGASGRMGGFHTCGSRVPRHGLRLRIGRGSCRIAASKIWNSRPCLFRIVFGDRSSSASAGDPAADHRAVDRGDVQFAEDRQEVPLDGAAVVRQRCGAAARTGRQASRPPSRRKCTAGPRPGAGEAGSPAAVVSGRCGSGGCRRRVRRASGTARRRRGVSNDSSSVRAALAPADAVDGGARCRGFRSRPWGLAPASDGSRSGAGCRPSAPKKRRLVLPSRKAPTWTCRSGPPSGGVSDGT